MNAQRYGRLGLSLAAALCAGALAPAAFGQDSTAEEEPAGPPLYRVEIIVFAHDGGNPSEEDFAHIARRESIGGSPSPGVIDEFDFGPYVAAEEDSSIDPSTGEISPRSGLVLTPDAESEDARSGPAEPGAEDLAADVPIDPFGDDPGNAVAAFRFRLLAQDELQLGDLRGRLERLDAYTPLVHGGWIQEALPPEQAKPFNLAYLGASMPAGTIRLHISRFLHLTLDLDYRPFAAPRASASPLDSPDSSDGAFPQQSGGLRDERTATPVFGAVEPTLSEVEVSRRYHLNAERRVRSGEVHYFDHPFFGVIAVVQPYERPEPPPTDGVRPAA